MLQHEPVARAELLVRRPVAEVFEAWIDPNVTSKFWFSRGDRRLDQGPSVRWFWDPFGIHADVNVIVLELNQRIVIEWPTPVEWTFEPRGEDATYVTRSEEHTSELQSRENLVCRLLLEKKNK